MDDIAPALLDAVQKDFYDMLKRDATVKRLYAAVEAGKATYEEVNEYAIKVGQILSDAFGLNLSEDVLPNGKMYVNIARKLLDPTMRNNYDMITEAAAQVQTALNEKAGLHLPAAVPELNEDRITELAFKAGSYDAFEDAKWCFGEPVINASQSVVDDCIKVNAERQYKMGLPARIVRRDSGNCCEWCSRLAGMYNYPDVPDDVYRRHRFCRCTVEYFPGDGTRQDVHTKEWKKIDLSKGSIVEKTKKDDIMRLIEQYAGKPIKNTDNQRIREWYVANVSNIPNQIDHTRSAEEQAKQAFALRNKYKHDARVAMTDEETAKRLERTRPALSWEELVNDKMERKGLSCKEAIKDIIMTASKTNADVNKEFGL